MKKEISPALLEKYLNGACDPEEEAFILAWYDSFEEKSGLLEELPPASQQQVKQQMMLRIRSRITDARRNRGRRIRIVAYAAAAAVLLFGMVRFAGLYQVSPPGIETIRVQAPLMVTNLTKSIRYLSLPDGSSVWLSPGSRLEYDSTFSKREISMSGEAFFDVSPDTDRPFVIYSSETVTRVLGTSFRIRAHENAPSTEVTVATGKVSVETRRKNGSPGITLLPNQQAVYLKETKELKKTESRQAELRIWQKASLSFDNASMREVMAALNKHFGVKVRTADPSLNDYLLKADFTDQNLPAILEMLEKSLNISYEIDDENILLKLQ